MFIQSFGSITSLQKVYKLAIDVQLLDASIKAGGVPEVPMVKSVRPDLGWYAGDKHGTVALLQMGKGTGRSDSERQQKTN